MTNGMTWDPLCVVHIVRPAEGGMRKQVRTLIDGMSGMRSPVAAPAAVLRALGRSGDNGFALHGTRSPVALALAGVATGRWARSQRANLLHGHGLRWMPLFVSAAYRARLPLVVTLHNLVPTRLAPTARFALQFCLTRAVRIIAVSWAVADSARAAFGPALGGRIRVIRNGIDLAPFAELATPDRAEIRRALALPADARVAICIARLSPEKNVAAFVRAAIEIAASGSLPRARFLIAGDGPERAALEAQIAAANIGSTITLFGERDDIPSLLRAADVVCVPSLEEGLGLVAIEAAAAGLPVVATAVGGLPEVVVYGETGLLAPLVGGADGIATPLAALLSDPDRAATMGAAGRQRAFACFGSERMVAETRQLYCEVLGRA